MNHQRQHSLILRWALVLVLLFAQNIAFAHAHDHSYLHDDSLCATCTVGQHLDNAITPSADAPEVVLNIKCLEPEPYFIGTSYHQAPYPIRGPPIVT